MKVQEVISKTAGSLKWWELYNLAQWQAAPAPAEEIGSTATVDPLFVCPGAKPCAGSAAFDFHLQGNSPAPRMIGFQPFDYTQAGRANPLVTPPPLPRHSRYNCPPVLADVLLCGETGGDRFPHWSG